MHEAEKAGYRPCLRCRPESAPHSPAWIGKSAVVRRAVKLLNSNETIEFDEDKFAGRFGVSARHLRRLFAEQVGKTPKQLAFEIRLNLCRKLISETALPISEIAFAAGFTSVRRFNDAFKARFKKSPSGIRRGHSLSDERIRVRLPYRPPFDFQGLINSYSNHRVGNLEWFSNGKMHRVVSFPKPIGVAGTGRTTGIVAISNDIVASSLVVEIDFPDASMIHTIITRVRNLFDLDSDPIVVANALESDVHLKRLLSDYPGIRIPTGWDPFEVAISAILGQLVSVSRGRSLVADLIEMLGQDSGLTSDGKKIKLFPTPKQIADADLSKLKTTSVRKSTLKDFSRAIVEKRISLEPTQDVDQFLKSALAIKGIGPWTAQYIALKAIRDADAFPGTDLVLARAAKVYSQKTINTMRPWRGYVAALIWRNHAGGI